MDSLPPNTAARLAPHGPEIPTADSLPFFKIIDEPTLGTSDQAYDGLLGAGAVFWDSRKGKAVLFVDLPELMQIAWANQLTWGKFVAMEMLGGMVRAGWADVMWDAETEIGLAEQGTMEVDDKTTDTAQREMRRQRVDSGVELGTEGMAMADFDTTADQTSWYESVVETLGPEGQTVYRLVVHAAQTMQHLSKTRLSFCSAMQMEERTKKGVRVAKETTVGGEAGFQTVGTVSSMLGGL